MRTQSNKPRGQKLYKCSKVKVLFGINKGKVVLRPLHISPIGGHWWFDLGIGEWYSGGYDKKRWSINCYYYPHRKGLHNVYSLKAAKRLIYKWNVPIGTKFKVSLPWIGYYFIVTK